MTSLCSILNKNGYSANGLYNYTNLNRAKLLPSFSTLQKTTTRPIHEDPFSTRCQMDQCDRYAKVHGLCLAHVEQGEAVEVVRKRKQPAFQAAVVPVTPVAIGGRCRYRNCRNETKDRLRYCVLHAKGRQCQAPGCPKYALRGGLCIAHGGGKKCQRLDCNTAAQSGGFCKVHGGGSRCKAPDCSAVARKSGLCIKHGGRNLCKTPNCQKTAHRGGHCISHGGGRRCDIQDCKKSAQSGGLCFAHGGGKRCLIETCRKGARQGGYCLVHGDEILQNERNLVS